MFFISLSVIKEELIEPELTKQYTDTRTKCKTSVKHFSVVDQLGLDDIEKKHIDIEKFILINIVN